jgi:hypothetical protein
VYTIQGLYTAVAVAVVPVPNKACILQWQCLTGPSWRAADDSMTFMLS